MDGFGAFSLAFMAFHNPAPGRFQLVVRPVFANCGRPETTADRGGIRRLQKESNEATLTALARGILMRLSGELNPQFRGIFDRLRAVERPHLLWILRAHAIGNNLNPCL